MFLITSDEKAAKKTLNKVRQALSGFGYKCGPIETISLKDRYLGWFRSRPDDNLHVYQNGVVIGKLEFGEQSLENGAHHESEMPIELNPLLRAVCVRFVQESIIVTPNGVTNIYVCEDNVSDMQLIIADLNKLHPSHIGVALLGTVGYFPGNETLFEEITRIPFLKSYCMSTRAYSNAGQFTYRKNDDLAMLDRLVSLVDPHQRHDLLVTGGYDSRTIAYCLRQANVSMRLIHGASDEQEIVEELARQLESPLIIAYEERRLSITEYTLITDAQIYAYGGNHQRYIPYLNNHHLTHTGHFVEALNKFPWNAAWKRVKPGFSFYKKLIRDGLLRGYYSRHVIGLNEFNHSESIAEYLEDSQLYTLDYYADFRPSELARWYFFLHRGLRWAPSTLADIGYHSTLQFLAGDQIALEYAISSSAFSNFANDRIRLLLAKVMPEVQLAYSNGQPRVPRSEPLRTFEKLYYEYGIRARMFLRSQKESYSSSPTRYELQENDEFRRYFSQPAERLFADPVVSSPVKRAAATTNEVLNFLFG